jgi:hypothetical protein
MVDSIIPFSNVHADFPEYDNSVLDFASLTSIYCPQSQGLLGELLSPEEWELLPIWTADNPVVAYVPPPNPGPEPVFVAGTAIANSIHIIQRDAWKARSTLFTDHNKAVNIFTLAYLRSIEKGSDAWGVIIDGSVGARSIPLRTIRARLVAHFAVMTNQDLKDNQAKLSVAFMPASMSMRLHVQAHAKAHRLAATAGQPYSELSKVQFLIESVTPCGLFAARISSFFDVEFTLVAQQTFKRLADALVITFENRALTATAASEGFAAAAVISPSASTATMMAEIQRLSAELQRLKSNAGNGIISAAPGVRQTNRQPDQDSEKLYCWTHGPCAHSGVNCTNPAIGHKTAATWSNKMGGRATRREYRPRKTPGPT